MGAIGDAFKEMDKKTLWWLVGGLGGLILLLVVLNLLSKISVKTYSSYETVETKLVEAAKKYYTDNSVLLPLTVNNTSEVTLNTLVVGEYIKPLNEYLKNGEACSASVVVTKLVNDYDYTPYLNCGTEYTSIELYKRVLEDNMITSTGIGLYDMGTSKVFRGEVKNNYISLNDQLWRIVKIDSNNNLVLLSNFRTDTYTWDDRYNQELDGNDGINNYDLSRVKVSVEEHYNSSDLLTPYEKSKVVYEKSCIGGRKYNEVGSFSSVECSVLSEEEAPIRLLSVGEYIEASIDPNCKTIEDKGCTNYNYILDFPMGFWTITKGQQNSSYVYSISTNGLLESRANVDRQLRYVITLSSKAFYEKGSGTYEDPYFIKESKSK